MENFPQYEPTKGKLRLLWEKTKEILGIINELTERVTTLEDTVADEETTPTFVKKMIGSYTLTDLTTTIVGGSAIYYWLTIIHNQNSIGRPIIQLHYDYVQNFNGTFYNTDTIFVPQYINIVNSNTCKIYITSSSIAEPIMAVSGQYTLIA